MTYPTFRVAAEIERGRYCTCPTWPCTQDTCIRCAACQQNGGPLVSVGEESWVESGEGLAPEEVERLERLAKDHGASSTRLYGIRRDKATGLQDDKATDRQPEGEAE